VWFRPVELFFCHCFTKKLLVQIYNYKIDICHVELLWGFEPLRRAVPDLFLTKEVLYLGIFCSRAVMGI
jgi:hypothetical protein